MTRYANILEAIGNTPVVRIGSVAPPDVALFVKIEAFNPLGSVKDRLALGVIEDAERSGQAEAGADGWTPDFIPKPATPLPPAWCIA